MLGPQRQRVDLPSGVSYWSVVDGRFDLVPAFDRFLFEERASRGRSEKTTAQYASGLVEFAGWADERRLLDDLVVCAQNLGLFMVHLRTAPVGRRGRGHGRARGNDRRSSLERGEAHWLASANRRFAHRKVRSNPLAWLRFIRQCALRLQARESGEQIWEWDTWPTDQLDVGARWAHRPVQRIYFSENGPAAITRDVLERLKVFLDDVRLHDWAARLPANATYYRGEIPRDRQSLPRFIDEFVMGQLARSIASACLRVAAMASGDGRSVAILALAFEGL